MNGALRAPGTAAALRARMLFAGTRLARSADRRAVPVGRALVRIGLGRLRSAEREPLAAVRRRTTPPRKR